PRRSPAPAPSSAAHLSPTCDRSRAYHRPEREGTPPPPPRRFYAIIATVLGNFHEPLTGLCGYSRRWCGTFFWVLSGWLERCLWKKVFGGIAETLKMPRSRTLIFRPTFFASFCESGQRPGGKCGAKNAEKHSSGKMSGKM